MRPATIYMIDGLGKPPPKAWNLLAAALSLATFAPVRKHDYASRSLVAEMRRDMEAGDAIIAVGHSLGGERLETLAADGIKLHAAVFLDGVRGNWEKRPFETSHATHAIAFIRRWVFGLPPSIGINADAETDAERNRRLIATHTSIIRRAAPPIYDFVKQAAAQ